MMGKMYQRITKTYAYRMALGAALVALVGVGGYALVRPDAGLAQVTIAEGDSRAEVVRAVGDALAWDEKTRAQFAFALRSIQWNALNEPLADYLAERHEWSETHRERFLTRANELLAAKHDMLEYAFAAGRYAFPDDERPAFVAEALMEPLSEADGSEWSAVFDRLIPEDVRVHADTIARQELPEATPPDGVHDETSEAAPLLPDLVPLPPADLVLRTRGGRTELAFSTTYYNIGAGALELVGDPETRGIREDHDRNVFQRIYRTDDTYADLLVGTFHWHQEHLHYHYTDFINYTLEPAGGVEEAQERIAQQKSTYCVRDVSKVAAPDIPDVDAKYRICGKELQGVSVGWGDTYFHTYGDQFFDVSAVESGRYTMTFLVNPAGRLSEEATENNESSTTFYLDKEAGVVRVLSHTPSEPPAFEHVYIKQEL